MKIEIHLIHRTDLQARVMTDHGTVEEYAEAMRGGQVFPPLTVYDDGEAYYLADGFHRLLAAERLGATDIDCIVEEGTRDDAVWSAVAANRTHGLKRTNADKRKAVQMALAMRPDGSDRMIANHVGVHHETVAAVRREMAVISAPNEVAISPGEEQVAISPREQKSPPTPPLQRFTPQTTPPPPPPRVGKDGKSYPPPPPPRPPQAPAAPPKAPEMRDKIGRVIPPDVVPLWAEAETMQAHLTAVSRLRSIARDAQDNQPLAFAEVTWQRVQVELGNAYNALKVALPHAVCPTCNGKSRKGCRMCAERGFISEFRWDKTVPQDQKDMIKRLVSKEGK